VPEGLALGLDLRRRLGLRMLLQNLDVLAQVVQQR
jgi:hypothetical protein